MIYCDFECEWFIQISRVEWKNEVTNSSNEKVTTHGSLGRQLQLWTSQGARECREWDGKKPVVRLYERQDIVAGWNQGRDRASMASAWDCNGTLQGGMQATDGMVGLLKQGVVRNCSTKIKYICSGGDWFNELTEMFVKSTVGKWETNI